MQRRVGSLRSSMTDSAPPSNGIRLYQGVLIAVGLAFTGLLASTLWTHPLFPFQMEDLAWSNAWLLTTIGDYYALSAGVPSVARLECGTASVSHQLLCSSLRHHPCDRAPVGSWLLDRADQLVGVGFCVCLRCGPAATYRIADFAGATGLRCDAERLSFAARQMRYRTHARIMTKADKAPLSTRARARTHAQARTHADSQRSPAGVPGELNGL
jgi:hypothetical protein